MARYSRDFLIPYLQDICALYMVIRKLEKNISEKQHLIKQYSFERRIDPPKKPKMEERPPLGCFGVFGVCLCAMGVLGLLCIIFDPDGIGRMPIAVGVLLMLIAIVVGWFIFWPEYVSEEEINELNKHINEEYLIAQRQYEDELRQINRTQEFNRSQVNIIQMELNELYCAKNQAVHVLNQVYAANVIPSPYRNIYAAVYLYNWFSTGGSDDLDHALSMFVLEEIKAKLDIVIEQQAQIIVNQRVMLANRQKDKDDQDRHNRMMYQKLDQIQASQDEHQRYERMIEANTAATAFFAAANYLKEI